MEAAQENKIRMISLGDIVERVCAIFVCILIVACMLPIWVVSIIWTQSFWDEAAQEYTEVFLGRIRDNIKGNLLFCILILLLLMVICVCVKQIKWWSVNVLAVLEAVGIVIFCWVYNQQLRPIQWADFGQIVYIAGQFANGDFTQFTAGSYLAMYPQQLGLICLLWGIIKLVGTANAVPFFQFVNCLCAGGILILGHRAVHCMWERKEIDVIYLLLQGFCLPVYFYTGIVYGEIISIVLLFIGIGQMAKMLRQKSITLFRMSVMLVSVGLAVTFRKNSLVVLIAMGIVLLVTIFKNKSWRLGVLLFVLILGGLFPAVLRRGVFGAFPVEGARPTSSWIYIGLGDGGGFGYGAYDGKVMQIMEEAGYDTERADEIAKHLISDRLSYFAEKPELAVIFLKEKILWQWLDPTFSSFTMTRFLESGYPVGLAYDIVGGNLREKTFDFMDSYQSLIYSLAVIGTIEAVRRREHFISLLWAIILLGGFFFSVLWEAKPRYIYPYFVLMLPICAYGVWAMYEVTLRMSRYLCDYMKTRRK